MSKHLYSAITQKQDDVSYGIYPKDCTTALQQRHRPIVEPIQPVAPPNIPLSTDSHA